MGIARSPRAAMLTETSLTKLNLLTVRIAINVNLGNTHGESCDVLILCSSLFSDVDEIEFKVSLLSVVGCGPFIRNAGQKLSVAKVRHEY
jgi:hypothetical protein